MSEAVTEQKPPAREIPVFRHIRRFFPNYELKLVFDIGANVGQGRLSCARSFPDARVRTFEPVPATYLTLKERTAVMRRADPVFINGALADLAG